MEQLKSKQDGMGPWVNTVQHCRPIIFNTCGSTQLGRWLLWPSSSPLYRYSNLRKHIWSSVNFASSVKDTHVSPYPHCLAMFLYSTPPPGPSNGYGRVMVITGAWDGGFQSDPMPSMTPILTITQKESIYSNKSSTSIKRFLYITGNCTHFHITTCSSILVPIVTTLLNHSNPFFWYNDITPICK